MKAHATATVVGAVLIGAFSSAPSTAAAAPAPWCGTDKVAASRLPDYRATSANQIHVLYATPADGADRFVELAPAIAADVDAIDRWWTTQDPARAPRFDLFAFPGCTTRAGMLDLGFARLAQAASHYAPDATTRIAAELAPTTPAAAKTLVYYDAPLDDPNLCGTSQYFAPQNGGEFGFTFVWLHSSCITDLGAGARAAEVAAHELVHNLGAVAREGPPHVCPGNPGHACDSSRDILWPFSMFDTSLATAILDAGRDDYYAHSGPWWDVQDSWWLRRQPEFQLSVATSNRRGSGEVALLPGSVQGEAVARSSCRASCVFAIESERRVELVALPDEGARFVGWSGDCSGQACSIVMDAARAVTATFDIAQHPLTVRVRGRGRVTGAAGAIACPKRCSARLDAGTAVRLVARPAPRQRFAGWSGACAGRRACVTTIDRARTATAVFRPAR